jgi:hypothetical protein
MSIPMGSPVTFEGGTVGTVDGFQVEKGGISVMVWVPDTATERPECICYGAGIQPNCLAHQPSEL